MEEEEAAAQAFSTYSTPRLPRSSQLQTVTLADQNGKYYGSKKVAEGAFGVGKERETPSKILL